MEARSMVTWKVILRKLAMPLTVYLLAGIAFVIAYVTGNFRQAAQDAFIAGTGFGMFATGSLWIDWPWVHLRRFKRWVLRRPEPAAEAVVRVFEPMPGHERAVMLMVNCPPSQSRDPDHYEVQMTVEHSLLTPERAGELLVNIGRDLMTRGSEDPGPHGLRLDFPIDRLN
jgi:hypothetical protein